MIASGVYLPNRKVSNSINQLADIYNLPVTRGPLKDVAVWIQHEVPLSDEQRDSERWKKRGSAAEALDNGVAVLIERHLGRSSKTINRHTFRGIGEIRENGGGSWGGHEETTVRQTNHP